MAWLAAHHVARALEDWRAGASFTQRNQWIVSVRLWVEARAERDRDR
jgi:hypothetical protein